MRVIPTRTHGVIDYVVGVVLILAPYLLGFADGAGAQYVFQIIGVATIAVASITDYELGLSRLVPMGAHLNGDLGAGGLLIVAPWAFGFADLVYWPYLIFGALAIGVALTTRTVPDDRRAEAAPLA